MKTSLSWLLLSLAVVIPILFLIYYISSIKNAYGVEWVAGDLIDYMKDNNNRWPNGWKELLPIHERRNIKGKYWCPLPFELMSKRICVDWSFVPSNYIGRSDVDAKTVRIVWLKRWGHAAWRDPNKMILEYLRDCSSNNNDKSVSRGNEQPN